MNENETHDTPQQKAAAGAATGSMTDLDELKQAAGKAALATMLAGSITAGAAAITPDTVELPAVTPIVQIYDDGSGADLPDVSIDDEQASKSSVWKRILQVLKYVLVALALIASVVFGVLKGCTACTGSLVAPTDVQEEQDSSSTQTSSSAQDSSSASGAKAA